jgi:hypothetical protein
MNKEIQINPDLFLIGKNKNKTLKKPNGKKLKQAILDSLSDSTPLNDLEVLVNTVPADPVFVKPDTKFGCLKNGNKPTLKQSKTRTIKQYTSFGKNSDTVKVLIKDKEAYHKVDKDLKKLEHTNMSTIRNYLKTRKLYKVGSSAPDDVLRNIYVNAQMAGNIENNNSETLVHNFVNE